MYTLGALIIKQIELTKGEFAIVDDIDYQRISQFKWTLDNNGYAVRKATIGRKSYRKVLLHRFITNAPRHLDVDHKNGNKLDNTRANLRVCTRAQNSMNRGPKPGGYSKFKGVTFSKRGGFWLAKLGVSGKRLHLGCFKSETDAAMAYDRAAYAHFGEYAYLNFPMTREGVEPPTQHLRGACSAS